MKDASKLEQSSREKKTDTAATARTEKYACIETFNRGEKLDNYVKNRFNHILQWRNQASNY